MSTGIDSFVSPSDGAATEAPLSCAAPPRPSFQLTRAADYAIRSLVHLAALPVAQHVSQPELARAVAVPAPFLAKVLQRLSVAGLIAGVRGARGGYAITEAGRRASMFTVIELIDGPVVLNTCLADGTPCARAGWCPAHLVWRRAERRLIRVLAGATITRLALMERRARTSRWSGTDEP